MAPVVGERSAVVHQLSFMDTHPPFMDTHPPWYSHCGTLWFPEYSLKPAVRFLQIAPDIKNFCSMDLSMLYAFFCAAVRRDETNAFLWFCAYATTMLLIFCAV